MSVTLAQASTIVDVALKKARDSNLAPLTVAVLDSAAISSPSSARTSPASCVSTLRTAKPGARSAWVSARAR